MDSDDDRRRARSRDFRGDEPSRKRARDDGYRSRSSADPAARNSRKDESAPILMTFKQWIMDQNNEMIEPDAASTGYGSYKVGERKKHVEQFFIEHKDEEWFKEKYHPEESANCRKIKETFLRERYGAWQTLYDAGLLKAVSMDLDNNAKVAKVLDASTMLMEGCTLEECINFINDGVPTQKKAAKPAENKENGEPPLPPKIEAEASSQDEMAETKTTENGDAENPKTAEEDGEAPAEPETEKKPASDTGSIKSDAEDQEDGELMDTKKPRVYKSLFIKNLPSTISKNDLAQVCKRWSGFIRTAFETIPGDQKFRRRAWVTFDDTVQIKDISWQLNNTRVRNSEIGSVVFVGDKPQELVDRVRNTPGISNHAPIAFRDLKLAVKCCQIRDEMLAQFDKSHAEKAAEDKAADTDGIPDDDSDSEKSVPTFWKDGVNPICEAADKFIQDYEDMYEEKMKEIMRAGTPAAKQTEINGEPNLEVLGQPKDDDLCEIDLIDDIFNVLDPLLMYLRIVHSIDFYSTSDYSQFEDEHPSRCGQCHVRGGIPTRGVSILTAKEFMTKFEEKCALVMTREQNKQIPDDKAAELGLKNVDDEVEKFVKDNSQRLEKDKYLCPLSGKKFKGIEYVRKHIFNKHGDKVEIVKRDCYYFNNYVKDAFKDGPPEPRYVAKPSRERRDEDRRPRGGEGRDRRDFDRRDRRDTYPDRNRNGHGSPMGGAHLSRYSRDQIKQAAGGREVIDYRDLDQPEGIDMFGE